MLSGQTLTINEYLANEKKTFVLLFDAIHHTLLVAGTFMYLSYSSTTEETLRSDKHLTTLNGPLEIYSRG